MIKDNIKHNIFTILITIFIIFLIIAVMELPSTIEDNLCIIDSDCNSTSKCINGICQSLIKIRCVDQDYKNIYQQSRAQLILEYSITNLSENKEDLCLDNKTLLEWFCENNTLKNQTFHCEFKCSEGRCIYKSRINGTKISSFESLIPISDYGLEGLAIKINNITHNRTSGYNYAFLTLTNSSGLKDYETRRVRAGSFTVFKYKDQFIKVSVLGIHASIEPSNSVVQIKVSAGDEYAQYYNSTD